MGDGEIADWGLPPLREGHEAPEGIRERRAALAGLAALHPLRPGVTIESSEIAGVACRAVGGADAGATILYFHGGGYRLGDPATWLGFASGLAADSGLRFVLPDYRLAPEHPFPAALHDAVAVYRALAGSGPVLLAGDSAGGGLAAALTALALENGGPAPAGLILLSPWLDLSLRSPSYGSHAARDRMFSRESALEAAALYLQGEAAEQPLASPVNADLSGFPPVLIFCGGDEVLLGDSLAFVRRLAEADRAVEAHFVSGMQHVWPMIAPDLAESAALRAHFVRFARAAADGAYSIRSPSPISAPSGE